MRATGTKRGRWWLWLLLGVLVVVLAFVAAIVVPILLHQNQGLSQQESSGEMWPTTVTARGDDGRERTLSVAAEDGGPLDTAAMRPGDRVVVTGRGYDGSQGIYVAVCVIPDSPEVKPGPCIGGVPTQTQDPEAEAGAIQWAPSNWINDDWAWRLFGARAYDDAGAGDFTAYLLIGEPAGEGFDCRVDRCGIVTRNDHTAAGDRVQDVYIPIAFAE